jgi:hypothetical protein
MMEKNYRILSFQEVQRRNNPKERRKKEEKTMENNYNAKTMVLRI